MSKRLRHQTIQSDSAGLLAAATLALTVGRRLRA